MLDHEHEGCHDVAIESACNSQKLFVEYINELVEMVVEELVGFFMSAFDGLALESVSSGHLR